jgi:hypothetical protein
MSSNGWKTLVSEEWAGCVLHNLPILLEKKVVVEKVGKISICGYQESAATWNYFDFKEKSSWSKNVSSG